MPILAVILDPVQNLNLLPGPEAARRCQPERHGSVMKFGAEMLVAAQAKSMLK